ncbi:MAG: hypothetical protein H7061_12460 [Bdellovibrionaceae bacterium]|nr:hypothetical protein [Bdellovibrio sp.]
MKIINFLFNMLTQRFEGLISASMMTVAQELINKSKKALLMGVATLAFGVFMIAGVLISIIDAARQFDTRGSVVMTAMLGSGLALVIVPLCALALVLWPRSKSLAKMASGHSHDHQSRPAAEPPPQAPASPLEEILAVVVMEALQYIKGKSEKKSEADHSDTQAPAKKASGKASNEADMKRYEERSMADHSAVGSRLNKTNTYTHFNTGTAN